MYVSERFVNIDTVIPFCRHVCPSVKDRWQVGC